jgi:hypothetical protein
MFTIEPVSGFGNTLKSFITFLSIGKTNIQCHPEWHGLMRLQPKDFDTILDESHICQGIDDYGTPYQGHRFRILESEDEEQKNLENELVGEYLVIYDKNRTKEIKFSNKTIDNFFDRSLICDKVFNRIMNTIDMIKWKPQVISEVERLEQMIIHPALAISVRTWAYTYEPFDNLTTRTDLGWNCKFQYNFETYKNAIEKFLPECKTIVISIDNENALPEYLELLKGYNVILYKKPEEFGELQYAATQMLFCSKCDFLVCSRLSSFSECIWWFSRCKQKVISLF